MGEWRKEGTEERRNGVRLGAVARQACNKGHSSVRRGARGGQVFLGRWPHPGTARAPALAPASAAAPHPHRNHGLPACGRLPALAPSAPSGLYPPLAPPPPSPPTHSPPHKHPTPGPTHSHPPSPHLRPHIRLVVCQRLVRFQRYGIPLVDRNHAGTPLQRLHRGAGGCGWVGGYRVQGK